MIKAQRQHLAGRDKVCGMCQARARAAEDEVASVRASTEQELEALRAQVQESSTVVAQWKEAYQNLQAQYEAAQVRHLAIS